MNIAATLTSHRDRPVAVTVVDGRRAVRKQLPPGRADEVFADMVALWASPFGSGRPTPGMPEPLRMDADGSILMALVDGMPMASRTDLSRVADATAAAAALLADLHASGASLPRRRTARKVVAACERALDGAEPGLVEALRDTASPLDEVLVCSHGDFGPHNVLLAPSGPVLIDFDRMQMAGAGRDVQHAAAWLFAATLLAGAPSWTPGEAFEDAYLTVRPAAAGELAATRCFHRAAALVRIATSWSDVAVRPEARDALLAQAAATARGAR